MSDTVKIQKIKVAGLVIYPATVLDAIKDAKSVKVEGAETNANYGKTLREILDTLSVDVRALSELGITSEQLAKIGTNESAIATLNGTATEDGSVAKAVADGIAGVVDSAPESFDTLKEIAEWIANDDNKTAAEIVAGVSANSEAIGKEAKAASEDYVPAEYYTQDEIDAASEGDDAYGKTAGDVKTEQVGTAAVEASGLYKKIEEAKEAAISAQHAKTTVTAGTVDGSISVDGGADIVICTLSVADTADTTDYDDVF